MIMAMKLSGEGAATTGENRYSSFRKESVIGKPLRGRPRRNRSSLKGRTSLPVEGRVLRKSRRVSFANSIEVKEFGDTSNENTPTQRKKPITVVQISTPIEDKSKRVSLSGDKSGIGRLSIIPKSDSNYIDDSEDFEPYEDPSFSLSQKTEKVVEDARNIRSAPVAQEGGNQAAPQQLNHLLSEMVSPSRTEKFEESVRDQSLTHYNNSDMELTLTDSLEEANISTGNAEGKIGHIGSATIALGPPRPSSEAVQPPTRPAEDPTKVAVSAEMVVPPSGKEKLEEESVRDQSVTHYGNSCMELTLTDSPESANVSRTEGKEGNVSVTDSAAAAPGSLRPSSQPAHPPARPTEAEMSTASRKIETNTVQVNQDLEAEQTSALTLAVLLSAVETVVEDSLGAGMFSHHSNIDMDLTQTDSSVSLEDKENKSESVAVEEKGDKMDVEEMVVVKENNSLEHSTVIVAPAPDEPMQLVDVPVVSGEAVESAAGGPSDIADNLLQTLSAGSTASNAPQSETSQSFVEVKVDADKSKAAMSGDLSTVPQSAASQSVTVCNDAPDKLLQPRTATAVTSGVPQPVQSEQLVLPSQSAMVGPRKVAVSAPLSVRPSIPGEIAELEKLPGTRKTQPSMTSSRRRRKKSPRYIHVPRTMVTRRSASSGGLNSGSPAVAAVVTDSTSTVKAIDNNPVRNSGDLQSTGVASNSNAMPVSTDLLKVSANGTGTVDVRNGSPTRATSACSNGDQHVSAALSLMSTRGADVVAGPAGSTGHSLKTDLCSLPASGNVSTVSMELTSIMKTPTSSPSQSPGPYNLHTSPMNNTNLSTVSTKSSTKSTGQSEEDGWLPMSSDMTISESLASTRLTSTSEGLTSTSGGLTSTSEGLISTSEGLTSVTDSSSPRRSRRLMAAGGNVLPSADVSMTMSSTLPGEQQFLYGLDFIDSFRLESASDTSGNNAGDVTSIQDHKNSRLEPRISVGQILPKPSQYSELNQHSGPSLSSISHSGPSMSSVPHSGPSLSSGPHSGPSLSSGPHSGPSLSSVPHSGLSLSSLSHSGPSLSSVPHSGPSLSSVPHSGPSLSSLSHSGPSLSSVSHSGPSLSSAPHSGLSLSSVPHSGPSLSSVPHSGPNLSSVSHSGPSLSSVPHSGPSLSFVPHSGPSLSSVPHSRPSLSSVPHSGPSLSTSAHEMSAGRPDVRPPDPTLSSEKAPENPTPAKKRRRTAERSLLVASGVTGGLNTHDIQDSESMQDFSMSFDPVPITKEKNTRFLPSHQSVATESAVASPRSSKASSKKRLNVTVAEPRPTIGEDTFFSHIHYLRSRFESISSSCLERLGNPTYVAAHPDFKEFLEVVINRANMGQSLLSLLIDYGRLSHVSSLATPVPVVKETINEAGPLESFEWMKKMILEVQQKWPDTEAALVSAADLYHWQVDLWSSSLVKLTIYNSSRLTFTIDGGHLNIYPQKIKDIKVSFVRGSLMSSVPPVKSYSSTSQIAQLIWSVIQQKR